MPSERPLTSWISNSTSFPEIKKRKVALQPRQRVFVYAAEDIVIGKGTQVRRSLMYSLDKFYTEKSSPANPTRLRGL